MARDTMVQTGLPPLEDEVLRGLIGDDRVVFLMGLRKRKDFASFKDTLGYALKVAEGRLGTLQKYNDKKKPEKGEVRLKDVLKPKAAVRTKKPTAKRPGIATAKVEG